MRTAVRLAVVIAACGLLAGEHASTAQTVRSLRLLRVERSGKSVVVGTLPLDTFALRVSPDGRQIVYDTGGNAIWIADLANLATPRRLATGRFPMWSADGTRVLFIVANSSGVQQLYWTAADGSGTPELLVPIARSPESWFPGGDRFTYLTLKNAGDYDVWSYSLLERKSVPLVAIEGTAQLSSQVSPDGRWIAYQQIESEGNAIYVEPLPADGQRTRVAAGERPVWARGGDELFFDRDGTLNVIAIATAPRLTIGTPTPLPIKGFVQGFGRRTYDQTADGRAFLMLSR